MTSVALFIYAGGYARRELITFTGSPDQLLDSDARTFLLQRRRPYVYAELPELTQAYAIARRRLAVLAR